MYIFDYLRSTVIQKFSDILKLANTKEELDTIRRKMEAVE